MTLTLICHYCMMILQWYSINLATYFQKTSGRAIALAFAEAGADNAICARSSEALDDVKNQIESLGQACVSMPLDISDCEAVKHFCDDVISRYGKVDILVNNADVFSLIQLLIPLRRCTKDGEGHVLLQMNFDTKKLDIVRYKIKPFRLSLCA